MGEARPGTVRPTILRQERKQTLTQKRIKMGLPDKVWAAFMLV